MTVSQHIMPHIPGLRRFARSLTGDQSSGDAYVAAALETLIADPKCLSADLPPRSGLYQLLLRVWGSIALNGHTESAQDVSELRAAESNLKSMTPLSRQAFLLVAVEGFSSADVAHILQRPLSIVRDLLSEAEAQMLEQVKTNVLIIEDEPLIALDLESIVRRIGHSVDRIVDTASSAIRAVQEKKPGLILADVHLADGSSGLDAVKTILQRYSAPVIFITAYPKSY